MADPNVITTISAERFVKREGGRGPNSIKKALADLRTGINDLKFQLI